MRPINGARIHKWLRTLLDDVKVRWISSVLIVGTTAGFTENFLLNWECLGYLRSFFSPAATQFTMIQK